MTGEAGDDETKYRFRKFATKIRQLEKTKVSVGQMPKHGMPKMRPMSPKTIRNLHGLLSSVLKEATQRELRARNPCALTKLPRTDDDGTGIDQNGEDIEFLTPEEVEGLVEKMERRSDQLLAIVKHGTGLRWGEISALAPMCILGPDTPAPKLRVRRAWKKTAMAGTTTRQAEVEAQPPYSPHLADRGGCTGGARPLHAEA